MIDQATELRKLVLQSARHSSVWSGPPSRMVVVLSGRTGVGVTTLAVNLSVALSEQGARVVLVDADLERQGVVGLCAMPHDQDSDGDAAGADIHELLRRGPAGIQIVPGLWSSGQESDWSEIMQERLLRQLKTLGRHADLVILDAGRGANDFVRRCARAANDLLIMSTCDSGCIMDSYARLKGMLGDGGEPSLQLVLNHTNEQQAVRDVYLRMRDSCRRFLGNGLSFWGAIPRDEAARVASSRGAPLLLEAPDCPASLAIQQIATSLWADCQQSLQALRRSA